MNHRIRAIALLGLVLALCPTSLAQSVHLGPVTNPANGHLYYRLTASNWTSAQAFANALGGHLVTINDAAENEWVRATLVATAPFPGRGWVGTSDSVLEGNFTWASGQVSGFSNWAGGQPSNTGDEDYVIMYDNGTWNDVIDSASPPGIGAVYGIVELDSPYLMERKTFDGGGGAKTNGNWRLEGSLGQHDAGPGPGGMAGGTFTLYGGFWDVLSAGRPVVRPRSCPADFNSDGSVNVGDIFGFLTAWFNGNVSATDFDGSGTLGVSDVLAYLTVWFAGCQQ